MKMSFLNGWLGLMVMGIAFAGCERKSVYNPEDNNNQPQGEFFDFSTSQEIKMNISYDVPEGYRVVFDIYDQLPMVEVNGRLVLNQELQPIGSGITNGYGKYDLEKVLPASVKDFYVYTSDLFATTLLHGKVENSGTSMEAIDLSDLQTDASPKTLSSRATGNWLTLGGWGSNGKPEYISKKKVDIESKTIKLINKTFPDTKEANSAYFKKTDLYVAEAAEIWLSVISSAGEFNNVLGYYCYTGEPEDLNLKDIQKIVAFPRAKLDEKNDSRNKWLTNKQSIQLKYYNPETRQLETTFPAGTRIGWVLISDGFNSSSGKISYTNECFYSNASWNPEKNNKNHMILFKTKNQGEDFVAFGFEDMNNYSGDQDCNDVMFHVTANPIGSITEEIPEIPDPETPDEDIVKDEIYRGTLAFEDLWPRQGDYDLNDVVIKYKSTATTVVKSSEDYDSYGKVTKVKDEFSLIWSGAVWHNAFGYEMNVAHSNIKSLKVTRDGEEVNSAWDKELDKVTVMLTEDVLEDVGQNTGKVMNYAVEIEFAEPILVQDFNKEKMHAPYNPFIVSRGGLEANRVEVHLPMYAPTTKHAMELLGTADDKSDVTANRYYVSEKQFPFAIHIFGDNDFINTEETKRIDLVYPKYESWVNSQGKEDADWYKYPVKE